MSNGEDEKEQEDIELVTSLITSEKEGSRNQDHDKDIRGDNLLLPSSKLSLLQSQSEALHARRLLYLSHSFAQSSEVAWQFCLTIFLAAFTNYQSLLLVSTYGFTTRLAVCVVCPKLGAWLDDERTNRLRAARILIGLENISLLVASFCCFLLLSNQSIDGEPPTNAGDQITEDNTLDDTTVSTLYRFDATPTSLVLIVLVHLFGSVVQVLDEAFLVAIERDWVVIMCQSFASNNTTSRTEPAATLQGNGPESNPTRTKREAESTSALLHKHLSEINVTMKQIDLTCKVVGPTIAGFLFPLAYSTTTSQTSSQGLEWACLCVGVINTLALIIEYVCTAQIYQLIPSLGDRVPASKIDSACLNKSQNATQASGDSSCSFFGEFRIYLQQPVALQGVALALLYCNGLTFGNGILTTYLLSRHIPLQTIGILRGIASAIGLLGTCAYDMSIRYTSLDATGLWSVVYECAWLGLAYLAVLSGSDESTVSIILLIMSVCASRIGLWVFDIAVTQLQQERIADGIRVRVGGVQSALNAFCTLASFTIGFLFPDPQHFYIFPATAFFSVALASLAYACGLRLSRNVT